MRISLVVPVFNEEEAIPVFYNTIRNYLALKPYDVEIVFVNDGSRDNTEALINELARKDDLILPLSFWCLGLLEYLHFVLILRQRYDIVQANA